MPGARGREGEVGRQGRREAGRKGGMEREHPGPAPTSAPNTDKSVTRSAVVPNELSLSLSLLIGSLTSSDKSRNALVGTIEFECFQVQYRAH